MRPKTFAIQTLGCRVNQYEAEQLAALLRSKGLVPAADGHADLKLVHTCSVTVQAASKSRQTAKRLVADESRSPSKSDERPAISLTVLPTLHQAVGAETPDVVSATKVILTGCWATSDPAAARALPGVNAVITHHDDVAAELDQFLQSWQAEENIGGVPNVVDASMPARTATESESQRQRPQTPSTARPGEQHSEDKWNTPRQSFAGSTKALAARGVNGKINVSELAESIGTTSGAGTNGAAPARGFPTLPLLDQPQSGRQRALLKIQDGCDAHCTYCIIPQLRPTLHSKSIDDTVEEATRLVASGHVEIVLTGIFLGAYGQPTALRRRQPTGRSPLADLIDALCTRVPGLKRVRLSSLEPGDLAGDLLSAFRSHEQVVPHFHLPLQSGCDRLLRRMNRQYGRDDFLRMVDEVQSAFDRPALTTDVIAGFPGETDEAFADTSDVVRRANFIHVHAFHFSPRPRTAAARWQKDFVRGPIVSERMDALRAIADENSLAFRQSFVGETVELLVEQEGGTATASANLRHGRCERYFDVWFEAPAARPGDFVRVLIESVTPTRTYGSVVER